MDMEENKKKTKPSSGDKDYESDRRKESSSRSSRDKDERHKPKERERSRERDRHDRDIRETKRSSPSRERRREEDKSSGRRRSRSRDRSKRERSVSPYVAAREKWDRFKKAESVMLSNISKRKEIYEKRPEDHPKYGDEWKLFWEKRYKELQAQGKDPNNHDFKAEWIPFWTKRVTQMFDSEVLEKTQDLMKKFELSSVTEPKRSDFTKEKNQSPRRRETRDRKRSSRSRSRERRVGGAVRNPSPPPQYQQDHRTRRGSESR